MSMIYHFYDVNGNPQEMLIAGAYAEHVGTLGFDENLSTTSRNAVENKAITQRILQDETNYLTKVDAETKYAVQYVSTTPSAIQDKIYSVNGDFYAGDSANSTLHELGKVKTVNSQTADSSGNVLVSASNIPTTTTGVSVQDSLDAAATKIYVQSLYPVGTIYMNDVASTVPFDFGTWDLIDAKFLYGCASDFSDIGNTGGATSVTLTQTNLPSGNVPVNFPAVTGTTGNVTGSVTTWEHIHDVGLKIAGDTANISRYSTYTYATGSSQRVIGIANNNTQLCSYTSAANLQHTHPITIPAQTLNIQLGDGTAFDIIPPYKKIAIWHRVS